MKVGLYYPWVYLTGGPERIIQQLVAKSRHDWTVFTNYYASEDTFPELLNAKIVEFPRVSVRRSFGHVSAAAWQIAKQKLPMDDFDALVVLSEGLGDFITFRNSRLPVICICLTPLRAAFDPFYKLHYLQMSGNQPWRRVALSLSGTVFQQLDKVAWRRYKRVFAISNEVGKRIKQGGLCPSDRVEILHPGIDTSRIAPSAVFEKIFLIPGRIMWTKNLELGIDAFRKLLSRRPDLSHFRLLIAGIVDQKSKPYAAKLKEAAGECSQIKFIESPSDLELLQLYQSAYAIVYPPFNEDWGLVPIEAMAAGKPVIATNRGGPLETIVHGETGFLIEPTPEAFANAMERLADNPELVQRLGNSARKHSARFDWQHFCNRIDSYLEEGTVGSHA